MTEQLVMVTIKMTGWWGNKTDSTMESEYLRSEGLSPDAATLIKNLVTNDFRRALHRGDSAVNKVKSRWLFPTTATSVYSLPITAKDSFKVALAEAEAERMATVRESLENHYMDEIERAKKRLGNKFNPRDYPTVDEIVSRFQVKVSYLPFPNAATSGVTDQELAEAIDQTRQEAYAEAHETAWQRLVETCQDFVTRLKNYHEKTENGEHTKFHATMVTNLQGLIESLEQMNVFGDEKLTAAIDHLKKTIYPVAPETLKNHEVIRMAAIQAASEILDGAMPETPPLEDWQDTATFEHAAEPEPKPEPVNFNDLL